MNERTGIHPKASSQEGSRTRSKLARALRQHVEGLAAFGVREIPRLPAGAADDITDRTALLQALRRDVLACRRCTLYRSRTQCVISDGSPMAQLMFVGEAPGREEDLQGKPFVGAAGVLLTKMIEAMGLKRQEVYICNVLKDRPPGNRTPLPEEMEACRPFLDRQIAIVQPRVICALGAVATKALLGPHVSITKVRGEVREYQGIALVPTFHPAYLLRNPPAKTFAWADLKLVKKLLARDQVAR